MNYLNNSIKKVPAPSCLGDSNTHGERQVQTWHELCHQHRWGFSTCYYSVPRARTWVPWPTFWSHCIHCRMFSSSPHTCCDHRNCLQTRLVPLEAESSPRQTLHLSPHSWPQHSKQPPLHTYKDLTPTALASSTITHWAPELTLSSPSIAASLLVLRFLVITFMHILCTQDSTIPHRYAWKSNVGLIK